MNESRDPKKLGEDVFKYLTDNVVVSDRDV
jgi:hypothetical protein